MPSLDGPSVAFIADDVGVIIDTNCDGASLMTKVWPREICAASSNERDGRRQNVLADVEHIHIIGHELLIVIGK